MSQHFIFTWPFLKTFTFNPIVGTVSTGWPLAKTLNRVVLPLVLLFVGCWHLCNGNERSKNQSIAWTPGVIRVGNSPILQTNDHNIKFLRVEDLQQFGQHLTHFFVVTGLVWMKKQRVECKLKATQTKVEAERPCCGTMMKSLCWKKNGSILGKSARLLRNARRELVLYPW